MSKPLINKDSMVPCKVCGRFVKRSQALSFMEISFICDDCLQRDSYLIGIGVGIFIGSMVTYFIMIVRQGRNKMDKEDSDG